MNIKIFFEAMLLMCLFKSSMFVFNCNRYFKVLFNCNLDIKTLSSLKSDTQRCIDDLFCSNVVWDVEIKANKLKYMFEIAFDSVIKYLKKGFIDK